MQHLCQYLSSTGNIAVVGGGPQIKFCLGPPKGLGQHCSAESWLLFKSSLTLHLTKSSAESRVRQINESCCLLAPTQPTSITSTTEYITPLTVYIQHLGNHCSTQSPRPTASWRLHWSTSTRFRSVCWWSPEDLWPFICQLNLVLHDQWKQRQTENLQQPECTSLQQAINTPTDMGSTGWSLVWAQSPL